MVRPFLSALDAGTGASVTPRFYFECTKTWTKKFAPPTIETQATMTARSSQASGKARRRPWSLRARSGKLAAFCLLGGAAAPSCAPPPPPKKLEMQPIGAWHDEPLKRVDESADSGVTAPNSGISALATAASPCVAAEIDNLEDFLRRCEAPLPRATEVPPLRDRLEVKVTASSAVAPGGRVELTVVLRNKTDAPLPLYFNGEPGPRFEIEAIDARGRRVDLPAGRWPGYPKGTKPEPRPAHAAKITLEKAGTARALVTWDAVRTRWAPERARSWEGRGHPRAAAGPLPRGHYMLRVVLPLVGDIDPPRVPIDVR